MEPLKIALIIVLQCTAALCSSYSSFDDYVQYVSEYINFTTYYELPTNNSELYRTTDTKIQDFGTFDFIIVGGGSAGPVLANRLSEIKPWKILLLEAGETENDFTDIPGMNYYLRSSPMNWGYYTTPQKYSCLGMIDRRCVYPTGKVLGGSGVIGDMVYARGSPAEYNDWATQGNPGWSFEEILPYFKKSERIQIPKYDKGYHGLRGEVYINYTDPTPINFDNFIEANKELGFEQLDYNGAKQIGISNMQWTINFNKRQSGGSAFVLPIMKQRKNLNVSLNSFVSKILIDKENKAYGVEFVKDGTKHKALASKEVLLSAGAINSPQLLMLSGVGPKDELEKHGITVINDLPVGKFFVDHPAYISLYVRTDSVEASEDLAVLLRKYLEGKNPLTSVFAAGPVMFMNTKDNHTNQPDLEIIFINPPMSVPADPVMFYNFDSNHTDMFSGFNSSTDHLIYLVNIQPKSVGSVTIRSNSPIDYPEVDPNYYSDPNDEDIEVIYEGLQYIMKMIKTPALQAVNAEIVSADPVCEHLKETSEREYWLCTIRHSTSTLYHPTGTTRMGNNTETSVVDTNLKVHNMKGLRVVDAGAIPHIMAGHPLAGIFMMAEKISDVIKREYGGIRK